VAALKSKTNNASMAIMPTPDRETGDYSAFAFWLFANWRFYFIRVAILCVAVGVVADALVTAAHDNAQQRYSPFVVKISGIS